MYVIIQIVHLKFQVNLKDYIHDNYGTCRLKTCTCLKEGWAGTACPEWQPINFNSFDDMINSARLIKEKLEKKNELGTSN